MKWTTGVDEAEFLFEAREFRYQVVASHAFCIPYRPSYPRSIHVEEYSSSLGTNENLTWR